MLVTYPTDDLTTATWIDLVSPTPDEIAKVQAVTGLRIPTENQISEIESTSRLAFDQGAYYLSTPLLAPRPDGEHGLAPLGLVLSPRVLLTLHFAALPAIDDARNNCSAARVATAEDAFLHILEVIVDRSADKLEHVGAACDELSRATFLGAAKTGTQRNLNATLERVGMAADRMSLVRDGLLGVGRIGAYIMEAGFHGAPLVNAARMKAIRADVASLTEYEAHLAGKVQFLLDATLGFINIEQNEIVKTLTIVSVVGVPPVLIAGIYGMNFRDMPELNWKYGYPAALVLIVVSALVPYLWFKRRRWM